MKCDGEADASAVIPFPLSEKRGGGVLDGRRTCSSFLVMVLINDGFVMRAVRCDGSDVFVHVEIGGFVQKHSACV